MQTVLIVGHSFHSLTSYLLEHGFEYVVLRDKHKTKHPTKKLRRRIVCDFSSPASVQAAIREVQQHQIAAVLVMYENYIVAAAEIAQQLGLPGIPVAAGRACTDKSVMRELFARAPTKISPDFAVVTDEEHALEFAATHEFPLILKPTNLAKSLLVSKLHNKSELVETFRATLQASTAVYQKYAPHKTPEFIIEEFMEGSIHSVDAFVDSKGVPHVLHEVVDYQTGYDIGYDDNFHYSRTLPSRLSKEHVEQIRHVASLGCQALGMKNSPAHIEIILTKQGPMIVEIGARNGGYRERMHRLANGIDITGNALGIAFGQQPEITATRNDNCAVLELFPKKPGLFKEITNLAQLQELPSLTYSSIKVDPGDFIGKASAGYKACAIIVLHNADSEQFARDLEFVNQNVVVATHHGV